MSSALDRIFDELWGPEPKTDGRPPHLTSTDRGTYYDSWGTPDNILNIVRRAGRIGLDMASSEEANKHVKADRYLTDAFGAEWGPSRFVNFCNPPGPGKLVHRFWDLFLRKVVDWDRAGAFLFFQADHLRKAEGVDTQALSVIPWRVKYRGAPSGCSFPSALVFTKEWIKRAVREGPGVDDLMLWLPRKGKAR